MQASIAADPSPPKLNLDIIVSTNNLKADSGSAEEQGESQIAKSVTNESEKQARNEEISQLPASADAMSREQSIQKAGKLKARE